MSVLHTVTVTGEEDGPRIQFTCHGDRDSECHIFPDCGCETWIRGEHEHPSVPHGLCWMQDWFDNDSIDPSAQDPTALADCGYRPGMSGPITTHFNGEYIEWEFTEAVQS